MRVAIYTRVSTGKQDYENQLYQLREFCKNKSWKTYEEYSEVISGKENDRPEFKKMMEDASKKKFDAIVVWSLDRFTREGTERVWHYISLLNSWGVKFISYNEPYFNTDNELVRDILLSVMGSLAKQERIKISDRTKAGLQRVRNQGKVLGKPKVPQKVLNNIIKLHEQGKNYREIRDEVYYWDKSKHKKHVSLGLVHKTLSKLNAKKVRK